MANKITILALVLIGAVFLIGIFLLSTAIVNVLGRVQKHVEKKRSESKPWSIRSDIHPYWSGAHFSSWSIDWSWNKRHYKQLRRETRRDQSRLQSVKLGG